MQNPFTIFELIYIFAALRFELLTAFAFGFTESLANFIEKFI